MKIFYLFALAEHIIITFAAENLHNGCGLWPRRNKQEIAMPVLKARVLFSLWLPRLVRLSADGEGKLGRAMMWNGGR